MAVTIADVKATGGFKTLTDAVLTAYLTNAQQEITDYGSLIPTEYQDFATLMLACHKCTFSERQVVQKGLDGLNVMYPQTVGYGLDESSYGREVKRLLERLQGPLFEIL